MPDIDKSKFIATFKAEADERISKMEQGLLDLENNPQNLEVIKNLNREAHSLKGAARMLGFAKIEEVSHSMEDLFSQISKGELEFNSAAADKVFAGIDAIKASIEEEIGMGIPQSEAERAVVEAVRLSVGSRMEYVKIPLHRVDKLMNLAGEMVVNKVKASYKIVALKKINQLLREHLKILSDVYARVGSLLAHRLEMDVERLIEEFKILGENISFETLNMEPLIEELQAEVRNMRMLPASSVFDAYPRLVRDLAKVQQKKVVFEINGGDCEIDKKILEEINPAMIHLLRNSVDHGIKTEGKIRLAAWHEGGNVVIQLSDDGEGMDLEKIKAAALEKNIATEEELSQMSGKEILNYIFLPGFSTAKEVTDISGRGVGMDVVKAQVEKLRGQIEIESIKGAGTAIVLRLPLTVALLQALMVKIADQTFAIPMLAVDEVIKINPREINSIEKRTAIELRGHVIPLVKLEDVLVLPKKEQWGRKKNKGEELHLIIASAPGKKVGFIVDNVVEEEEIYIKPIGGRLGKLKNIEGATILGTGEVIVVLDVQDLVENARYVRPETVAYHPEGEEKARRILIAEDALTTRELERSILETQGYSVVSAVDGLDAVQKVYHERPDLIIADVNMPRMDGFEMCKMLKSDDKYKDIPIVILTSREKEEDLRKGLDAGADAYLAKSKFDQQNLLETIGRFFE